MSLPCKLPSQIPSRCSDTHLERKWIHQPADDYGEEDERTEEKEKIFDARLRAIFCNEGEDKRRQDAENQ